MQSKPHLPGLFYESPLQGLKGQMLQQSKERDRDDFLVGLTLKPPTNTICPFYSKIGD